VVEWVKAVILGIVEGLTEFVPVSSTGHLIIVAALLDFQHKLNGTFDIFIQLGSTLALIAFYWADLTHQVRVVRTDKQVQRLWMLLFIAFVPAVVIGFFFEDRIKTALYTPVVVALALIVGGIIFLVVERRPRPAVETSSLSAITWKQALAVGISQLAAFIPGASRSGSTIIGGLLAGLDRPTATTFSFYLAIPTLLVATVGDFVLSVRQISSDDLLYLLAGTVTAAIFGWLSIRWLLRYIARNSFVAFGYYRIVLGIIILVLVAAAKLQ
jgi:undecaprenyl-diphosphatase